MHTHTSVYIYTELLKLCYHPGWRLMRLGYRTCFHTLYDENIYIYIYYTYTISYIHIPIHAHIYKDIYIP